MMCSCGNCQAAHGDPALRRTASCVAIVWDGQAVLLDATPDLRHQWALLPLEMRLAGVALTHAHAGHVAGLTMLGKEGPQAKCPLIATPSLHAHVARTDTFADGCAGMQKHVLHPGDSLGKPLPLRFHPLRHRAERSDTVAIEVGGRRRILYLPDTDAWDDLVDTAVGGLSPGDILLFDATFWSAAEVGHRDVTAIPHPFVEDTLPHLARTAQRGVRVILTHLNHTNPLLDPSSHASQTVAAAGVEVAYDGMRVSL